MTCTLNVAVRKSCQKQIMSYVNNIYAYKQTKPEANSPRVLT